MPLPEILSRKYEMVYNLEDANLQAGKYEAIVKVKNAHSWSGNSDPALVEIGKFILPLLFWTPVLLTDDLIHI